MTKLPEPPHKVDLHVGAMIRVHRKLAGISQGGLAAALGVSFQQIQKYERGTNRVSASKLYEIAQKLNVPLSAFFAGLDDGSGKEMELPDGLLAFALERGAIDLVGAFMALSPERRRNVVDLAVSLAEPEA